MKKLRRITSFLFNHPITKDRKMNALMRFAKWQVFSRLFPHPVVYPFVEKSRLLVKKGMAGATGNLYAGLHEFEDMAFVLHLLRPNDIFGDIGANIGSYTILASSVAGAHSLAVEPVPSTFNHLKNNVSLNNVELLVSLNNAGIGACPGKLKFTLNDDTVNHVVVDETAGIDTVEVEIQTIDGLFGRKVPLLIKMDVEGFEMEALKGAEETLKDSALKALIVELNGCCRRYGVTEEEIDEKLTSIGFGRYQYLPFERKLNEIQEFNRHGNTIYARDLPWIQNRLSTARKFSVLHKSF